MNKTSLIGCKPQFWGWDSNTNKMYAVIRDDELENDFYVWYVTTATGYSNMGNEITEYALHTLEKEVDGLIIDCGKHFSTSNYLPNMPKVEPEQLYVYAHKGMVHRVDGPAIISLIEPKLSLYFLFGEQLKPLEYWNRQKDTEFAPQIFSHIFGEDGYGI